MDCVVTTGAPRSVVGRLPRDRDSVRPCASLRTHRPAGAGRLACGPLATADVPCRHHRRTPTMTKEPEPYLLERLVVCATRSPTSRPALSRLSDHGSELGGCPNPASNGRQAPATSFRAGDAEAERQFPGRGRLLPACPTDSPSRSPGCTGSTDSVTTIRSTTSTTSTTWQPCPAETSLENQSRAAKPDSLRRSPSTRSVRRSRHTSSTNVLGQYS
jgi:hypothetical protein